MDIDLNPSTALSVPSFDLGNYVLREIRSEDIQAVFAGLSNPSVIRHYGVSYHSLEATVEQMRWYERLLSEREGIWWGIARHEDDELIGACGFSDWIHEHRSVDLGYWLLPAYWRRGIMQKALPEVLRHAFRHMNIHRVHADVEPENAASFHLLRKLGFLHEGTLRDVEYKEGSYVSLHQLSIIQSDPVAMELHDPNIG
ncbi:GNAT family N-acetyltransferase [Pseudomonas sp. PS02290]|uniref:GNAT family N-acetyltransferase n=1 Tax=Pseudomonas sp. PS02290 TaxID=2991430 RepID=UPI00249C1AE0|nr:GNAT family protein [Pseudomonas sp. PS02290]